MGDSTRTPGGNEQVIERTDQRVTPPDMYKVLVLNDHYTPREFVVEILMKIFRKKIEDANQIMMTAHRSGKATVGLYTFDIANTKVTLARKTSKTYGYPLKFVVEGA